MVKSDQGSFLARITMLQTEFIETAAQIIIQVFPCRQQNLQQSKL